MFAETTNFRISYNKYEIEKNKQKIKKFKVFDG